MDDGTPVSPSSPYPTYNAAIWLADRGIASFPVWGVDGGACRCGNPDCADIGKHPMGHLAPRGALSATTDPDYLRDWFIASAPEANIGAGLDGLLVIDVDPRNGGAESLALLSMPATLTADTGGGGKHFVFAEPQFKVNKNSPLGAGIDIKSGSSSYIVVAPSVHASGQVYRWVDLAAPVLELPVDLADALRRKEVAHPGAGSAAVKPDAVPRTPEVMAGAQREIEVLANEVRAAAPGTKHQTLIDASIKAGGWLHMLPDFDGLTSNLAGLMLLEAVREAAAADVGRRYDDHKAIDTIRKGFAIGVENPKSFVPIGGTFLGNVADFGIALAPSPSRSYFDAKGKFLPKNCADDVDHDLAIGTDHFVWKYVDGRWVADDDEIKRRVVLALGNSYKREYRGQVEDIVRTDPEIPHLTGDPHTEYINIANGMYQWRTGQVLAHSPSYLSTNQLPVVFDPTAACPAFDQWLTEVLPADAISMMWEVVGYMLLNGNPLHVAMLLVGEGGNGKSTLLRLLTAMLGKWNTSAVTLKQMTSGTFEIAGMFGKVANIAGDIPATYIEDTARFKEMTGGDTTNAQHKYGKPFGFTNWAVPIFSVNEIWRSADTTEGYFRRWIVLPFDVKVVGLGGYDESKLHAEIPGIFAAAMVALRRLMARGHFDAPPSVRALGVKFQTASDAVMTWLSEDDEVEVNAAQTDWWEPRTQVYKRYAAWARDTGHRPVTSTTLYKRLHELHYEESKRRGDRGFRGVQLRSHTYGTGTFLGGQQGAAGGSWGAGESS